MKTIRYTALLILLAFIFSACTLTNKNATRPERDTRETGSIIAQAEWPEDVKSDLVTVRMTVSASDMETVSQDFRFSGRSGDIHGIHGMPAGDNRTILIEGLSSDNTILYRGSVSDIIIIPGQVMYGGFITMDPVSDKPLAQLEIRADSGNEEVTIQWETIPGADSYSIYMSISPGASKRTFDARKSTTSNSFTWSGLRNGKTYYFIVTSENSSGESIESNELSVAPGITPKVSAGPSAPGNARAVSGNEEVTIRWNSIAKADSYSIYMSMSPGASKRNFDARKSTTSNSYTWSGLRNGKTYYFVVTSENRSGESSESNKFSAAPGTGDTIKPPKTRDKSVVVPVPTPKHVPVPQPKPVPVPKPEPAPRTKPAPSATKLSPTELLNIADQTRAPGATFSQEVKVTYKKGDKSTTNVLVTRVKNAIKSLAIYKYPASQKGRVILMVENNMWIYFPGTKKPIRISPAQQLLGQVSNADVSRVVYSIDYDATSVEDDNTGKEKLLKLNLKAKTKGAAYGSIELWMTKDRYRLVKAKFYTLAGRILKTIYYKGYKNVQGKERPMIHEIHDAIKKSEITIMEYSNMKVQDTPDNYFQKTFMSRAPQLK